MSAVKGWEQPLTEMDKEYTVTVCCMGCNDEFRVIGHFGIGSRDDNEFWPVPILYPNAEVLCAKCGSDDLVYALDR